MWAVYCGNLFWPILVGKFTHCQEPEYPTGHCGRLRAERPRDLGSVCDMNNKWFSSPKRTDLLGSLFYGGNAAGAWSWPLAKFTQVWNYISVRPIRLRGVILEAVTLWFIYSNNNCIVGFVARCGIIWSVYAYLFLARGTVRDLGNQGPSRMYL